MTAGVSRSGRGQFLEQDGAALVPSLLEAKGLVRVIQRSGKYLKGPGCVMFGTEYIKKNPDVVRRFVKAHFRIA